MTQKLVARIGSPAGITISPDLWGIFLEDLNDALDGGLNAEQVRNGDFEFSRLDQHGWGPLTGWQVVLPDGRTRLWARTQDPVHPNNATYVRLLGPVTLRNEGWDGVRVRAGASHRVGFAARVVHGAGSVRVVIRDRSGVLAEATVAVAGAAWAWYSADLPGRADGRGILHVELPEDLAMDLDAVSLRPVGTDGEALTFRPDLLAALADLRPSFVRFPGGCLAHGTGLENVYHWKDTVGPRHTRRHTFNPWGYHQSMSIGYVEYFALCEQLGATPLPVVAAGVCCQNTPGGPRPIPDEEMPAYIQDVLDLVEFANGPVDSAWGAIRAQLGHPEPYRLRYLGLGNEDQITDDFRDRYARIEEAVRAAHPDLTVIGTVGPSPSGSDFDAGWRFARERDIALVDEHFYCSPRWFHQNTDRYAGYPRSGPGVYVGEYAAHGRQVRSALAEAALMIGMECDSDVVRLASYAPLLARNGHSQWVPDLIYFDADRVLPSASYDVQRLFGTERGVEVHDIDVEGADPVPVPALDAGTVRVSAPTATVSFRGIEVDGVPLPELTTTGEDPVELAAVGATRATVTFTAERVSGTDGFVVELGAREPGAYLALHVGAWQNKSTLLVHHGDGQHDNAGSPEPWAGVMTGVPVEVTLEVDWPRTRVWVDGRLRHDVTHDERPERRVVAGAASRVAADGVVEYVVRLVNATATARETRVELPAEAAEAADAADAAASVTADVTASATVLAGTGPDDGGPFEASPMTSAACDLTGNGGVELTLPPWSFAVLVVRREAPRG
ncbi:alpha-L-arabinofuranosidase C-terminal domain-containing protein [Terrabacter sp. MAHUQ-38]|uniref:alpha-L-arabinofuranosidase C-terminal domain-containing protein n=1 Tax=unclassified Terrabacter TaxID=2630222 RepID=UPI00165E4364|nr:alpha-L-arabinofuranosidase C-terminal domain-containing protein [Terrabacter sp. MAHUQ-38]MBC9824051.1 alpha-N-arabinofuranosidase [Terrabacter sp. MAHUQ-38]